MNQHNVDRFSEHEYSTTLGNKIEEAKAPIKHTFLIMKGILNPVRTKTPNEIVDSGIASRLVVVELIKFEIQYRVN